MKHNKVFIYGKHAVEEALTGAPKALTKVYIDPRVADKKLVERVKNTGIPTGPLSLGAARSDMKSGAAHQGIIGQLSLHELVVPYQKFIDDVTVSPSTALVLLSGIQDPHNVGALVRSSAGFGASGVLMPERGQAPVTSAVIKVSAGMAFSIPLVNVGDVIQTIVDLKKRGFKIYALAGEGSRSIVAETFDAPTVFILGNEGEGVPKAIRSLCDAVLSIPTHVKTESLNVAASGAIALYTWSMQHPEALQ